MTPSQSYRAALEAAARVARAYLKNNEAAEAIAERIECLPVPEDAGDMVLVPREPTQKMLSVGHTEMEKVLGYMVHQPVIPSVYRAMIGAAGGKP